MKNRVTENIFKAFSFLAIAMVFFSCSSREDEASERDSAISVTTVRAKAMQYEHKLPMTGTVFANREANLGAGFPGKVERILYPEGTYVKEGDLLVEMAGEMMAQAEAEYITIKRDYERVSRLVKDGSVSQQEYDHVKARYQASKAKYDLAKKNTEIRAPFSGIIVDYLVNEGENYLINFNLEPGYSNTSGILRLMQLNPVKLNVEINERDLRHIDKGLLADVKLDAYPEELFDGEVSLIKPYLSTTSRTSTVEITVSNSDMRIKPGMFGRVEIKLPSRELVFIPIDAIYRNPETGKEQVAVIKNQVAEIRNIERLQGDGGMVAISNVADGEEIIVGGKSRVDNGSEVKIVNNGGEL